MDPPVSSRTFLLFFYVVSFLNRFLYFIINEQERGLITAVISMNSYESVTN